MGSGRMLVLVAAVAAIGLACKEERSGGSTDKAGIAPGSSQASRSQGVEAQGQAAAGKGQASDRDATAKGGAGGAAGSQAGSPASATAPATGTDSAGGKASADGTASAGGKASADGTASAGGKASAGGAPATGTGSAEGTASAAKAEPGASEKAGAAPAAGAGGEAQASADATGRPGKRMEITGRVESVTKGALTLENGQVRLTEETQFGRDGKTTSWDEVQPGSEVRAAYEPRGELAYATEIEILSSGEKGDTGSKDAAGTGQEAAQEPK